MIESQTYYCSCRSSFPLRCLSSVCPSVGMRILVSDLKSCKFFIGAHYVCQQYAVSVIYLRTVLETLDAVREMNFGPDSGYFPSNRCFTMIFGIFPLKKIKTPFLHHDNVRSPTSLRQKSCFSRTVLSKKRKSQRSIEIRERAFLIEMIRDHLKFFDKSRKNTGFNRLSRYELPIFIFSFQFTTEN